jgi:hypothetical protein
MQMMFRTWEAGCITVTSAGLRYRWGPGAARESGGFQALRARPGRGAPPAGRGQWHWKPPTQSEPELAAAAAVGDYRDYLK